MSKPYLEYAADTETAGASASCFPAEVRTLSRGKTGSIVPGIGCTLLIGEPDPRDQI